MRAFLLPGTGLLLGLLFLAPLVRGDGQPPITTTTTKANVPDPKKTPAAELPLSRIVLYNAGIGFFHREGDVSDNAHFDLRFDEADVNDLLKSLVLSDKDGGKIQAVTYDNRLPVDFVLKGFSVDVTENPTMGQLLHQVRGEKVEVTDKGGVVSTGQIVSVQQQVHQPMGVDPGELLNLLTEDGLQNFELKQLKKIKFTRAELQADFRKALELLASSRGDNKKTVSVVFTGKGKRRVAIGYVMEAPLWKPSYRLAVDEKGATRIQGWATVENTSDEDWNNVKIGLVAGRPMSFQMDMYDPLFVPRPTVEPELFASLRPPMYQGGLNPSGMAVALPANPAGMMGLAGGMNGQIGQFGQQNAGQFGNSQNYLGGMGGFQGIGGGQFGIQGGYIGTAPYLPRIPRPNVRSMYGSRLSYAEYIGRLHGKGVQNAEGDRPATVSDPLDRKAGALAAADSQLGDMFEYTIEERVTLPRQKSALLPIVDEPVQSARVSIYNATVLAKYPLLGLRLVNKTKLSLAAGPVAVYDGGTYAGDARLPDMKPNETRLVSYAIDLGTEVVLRRGESSRTYDSIKVLGSMLEIGSRERTTMEYLVRNRNPLACTMIIEHPRQERYKLIVPAKPTDQTRNFYRFELPVKSGELATLEVVEEWESTKSINVHQDSIDSLEYYIKLDATRPAVREVLKRILQFRAELARLDSAIASERGFVKELAEDQERMRKNLEHTPKESETYKRFLKKLDEQETEIEKHQSKIKDLLSERTRQLGLLRDYTEKAHAE